MAKIKYFTGKTFAEIEVDEEVEKSYKELSNDERRRVMKEKMRETTFSLEIIMESDPDNDAFISNSLVEDLYQEEEIQRLKNAIKKLTVSQQRLLKEIFFEDKSMAQVANEQNVDSSAIRHQMQRIIKRLRKILN